MAELKPCPRCWSAWLYASEGDYTSGYEAKGYKVNFDCGHAWQRSEWQKTEDDAIKYWNRRANRV